MKTNYETFQEARKELIAILDDPAATVGARVETGNVRIGGNLVGDDPSFSPVYVDQFGRLWKEECSRANRCVELFFDPRSRR